MPKDEDILQLVGFISHGFTSKKSHIQKIIISWANRLIFRLSLAFVLAS